MRVIACYNVWNEIEFLKDSLDSVDGKVDLIVIVDGRYIGGHGPSDDGTLELIESYPFKSDVLFIEDRNWKHQMQKRSQYFVGEEGDWYFVIDADEVVLQGLDEKLRYTLKHTISTIDGYRVRLREHDVRTHWKLLRHKAGIHYGANHAHLVNGDGKTIENFGWYLHLVIDHRGWLRKNRVRASRSEKPLEKTISEWRNENGRDAD